MDQSFIKIRALQKSYGKRTVLHDVSFDLASGEKVVLIGRSGSGKSTLLRCLMGLEDIDGGEIRVDNSTYVRTGAQARGGKSVDKLIRSQIGMVFQHYTLFPHLSVLNNLVLAPIFARKEARKEATERAMAMLRRLDLEDKAGASPGQLSGGQKQRVAIARALLLRPRLMLFDEVTSALDPELVAEVEALMMELARDNMSMMIVTHDIHFARRIATRVLFFDDGTLLEDGPPEEVFTRPKQKRTREFLQRVMQVEELR